MKFVSLFAWPWIIAWTQLRLLKKLEDPIHYKNRYGRATQARPNGIIIWLHAASVGEVTSLIPLVEGLKKRDPNLLILLTTTTVQGKKIVQHRLNDHVIHQFLPFDVWPWIKRFLNYWKPHVVLLLESEIWPNLILEVAQRKIPLLLINARLSSRTIRNWSYFPLLAQSVFSKFCHITVANNDLRDDLKKLGAKHVEVMPHLKYAAERLPYNQEAYSFYKPYFDTRPSWVAASTHPGEDEIILACHQQLKKRIPNLLTVIVPRHIQRTGHIITLCQHHDCPYVVHSQRLNQPKEIFKKEFSQADILIGDTLGELGLFFALSHITFIGGSLVPYVGGHNPIEPALFSNAVLWGPYIHKSKDICHTLEKAAFPLKTSEELKEKLLDLFKDHSKQIKYGQRIFKIVQDQGTCIQKIIQRVMDHLP